MPSSDQKPIMVCRIHCPPQMEASVDEWMPKHFDDSLDHEAVTSVASYRVMCNYQTEGGFPAVLNGHGNRFIVYVGSTTSALLEWIDSPMLRDAIDDGVDRESSFPELDGEPFTGNIYEVRGVASAINTDFPGPSVIFAERFEVGPAAEAEFSSWLEGRLEDIAKVPNLIRARTFEQLREVPDRFPYTRYKSKGNRMLLAEFPAETAGEALVTTPHFRKLLEDSARWDLRLPYVRREIAVNHVLRDKRDAESTWAARRD